MAVYLGVAGPFTLSGHLLHYLHYHLTFHVSPPSQLFLPDNPDLLSAPSLHVGSFMRAISKKRV